MEGNGLRSSKSGPKVTAWVWVTLTDSLHACLVTLVVFRFCAFLSTSPASPSKERDEVHSPHWAEV